MPRVLVGTSSGLLTFDPASRGRTTALDGHPISALAPSSWKQVWAVVDDLEIWRAGDLDGEWKRVSALRACEANCIADTRANDEDGILIGTSKAHLFRIAHEVAEPLESFDHAPGRDLWFTPWGGPPAVRSITENRDAVFVNVHVGGVLRSRDRGDSWEPTIDVDADVHRVVTGSGRVYAAGARGLSISGNGGDDWKQSARGLHAPYCRSVAVSGETVLLSASDGPGGGRAALYRTDVEAKSFERCRAGLPEWFEGNIDSLCLDALPDGSLSAFASESGQLYTSRDEGSTWSLIAEGLPSVRSVLVLP